MLLELLFSCRIGLLRGSEPNPRTNLYTLTSHASACHQSRTIIIATFRNHLNLPAYCNARSTMYPAYWSRQPSTSITPTTSFARHRMPCTDPAHLQGHRLLTASCGR